MNEYQIDYRMGNITDNSSIQSWLGNQKNNLKSIEDYTFDGTAKIIGLKKDGYMFHFNSDGTEVEMYNINYELAGGTNEENAVTSYSKGDTVQLPVPTKEGAQFIGWSRNNNDTENTISNITADMEGDITLYACWINELPEDYFAYNTNGDGIIGFSTKGSGVYDNAQEMDLAFPSKHKVNNNDVIITSVSGFSDKIKIKNLIIPNTITSIANSTFSGCTGIKYLKVPISIWCSGDIFINTCNIEEVYFSKGTGTGANYNQYDVLNTPWYISRARLTKVTLEKGITSIGNYTFNECNNISTIKFTGTEAEWNAITKGSNNSILSTVTVECEN